MNNDKKVKYVKIGDEPVGEKKKKKKKRVKSLDVYEKPTPGQIIIKCLGIIGTTISAMLLVIVIAVCIIVTSLALYVAQFAETDFDVSLEEAELSTSTFLYAYDSEGQEVQLKQLSTDKNRVLVDIEDIPQHVIDAFTSAEDARFYEHDGVDWRRTVAVTVRMVLNGGTEGGSTITQQLVRDITGDKEVTIGRKLREVFRALELEKKYSKDDIMESYLNRIGFGGTSYGIASASVRYFDKEPSELTIAEAAILAGIVRSPTKFNPYADLSQSRKYQLRALRNMYDYGYITTKEYEDAVNEKVRFRLPVKGDDFGYVDERYNEYYGIQDEDNLTDDLYYENTSWEELGASDSEAYIPYRWNGDYEVTQNWYVDAAIDQIVNDLAELRGITKDAARTLFYNGGFKAYLNMNIEMQNKIEELFKDPYFALTGGFTSDPVVDLPETAENEIDTVRSNLIQGSFVLMNYNGTVLALVGGLGEKEGDGCFNRATMDPQIIGSTIKPLSVYSLAIENNLITYSSFLQDISGKIPSAALGPGPYGTEDGYDPEDDTVRWPHNYQEAGFGDGLYYPAWYAVQKSKNTMAVNVLSKVGLQKAFTQLSEKLHIKLDPVNDMAYSPLALGSITEGVTLVSLAAAYSMIGNGGLYYEPYLYSKVVDNEGRIVLSQNVVGERVISSDTAYITNRMMRTVITDGDGSGRYAQLDGIEVVGKTGTANDESTLCFVGLTPSYIGAYRVSRDNHKPIDKGDGWRIPALVWNGVMKSITEGDPPEMFVKDPNVLEQNYCPITGFLAGDKCYEIANQSDTDTIEIKIGYYRKDNLPKVCDGNKDHSGSYFIEHYGNNGQIPFYG